MADQGAAKIKSLLDTPSASLSDLMNTLQSVMSQALSDDNLSVPTATFTAINAARGYYRNLAGTVRSISTSSPGKAQVLAALKQLDASLVSLSKGLQQGTGDNAMTALAAAEQQSAQAGTQLRRASKALA